MRPIDSLPNRPLRHREIETIEAVDGAERAIVRFFTGGHRDDGIHRPDDSVGQFDLFLSDGRALALHFDVDASEWFVVGAVQDVDVEDRGDAVEQLEDALVDVRGDHSEYGQQLHDLAEGST